MQESLRTFKISALWLWLSFFVFNAFYVYFPFFFCRLHLPRVYVDFIALFEEPVLVLFLFFP